MHPARIWFAIAVGLVAAIGIAAAVAHGHRRLHEIYREHLRAPKQDRLFLASLSFFFTFAGVRMLTHAIHSGRGPFRDVVMGGRHIHHLVWGILILLLVGYLWLLHVDEQNARVAKWMSRTLSVFYGVGAALTLDEFALWLNLRDVYWDREGRESVDAALLFGGLLSIGVWGGRFLHALAREVIRPGRK